MVPWDWLQVEGVSNVFSNQFQQKENCITHYCTMTSNEEAAGRPGSSLRNCSLSGLWSLSRKKKQLWKICTIFDYGCRNNYFHYWFNIYWTKRQKIVTFQEPKVGSSNDSFIAPTLQNTKSLNLLSQRQNKSRKSLNWLIVAVLCWTKEKI